MCLSPGQVHSRVTSAAKDRISRQSIRWARLIRCARVVRTPFRASRDAAAGFGWSCNLVSPVAASHASKCSHTLGSATTARGVANAPIVGPLQPLVRWEMRSPGRPTRCPRMGGTPPPIGGWDAGCTRSAAGTGDRLRVDSYSPLPSEARHLRLSPRTASTRQRCGDKGPMSMRLWSLNQSQGEIFRMVG